MNNSGNEISWKSIPGFDSYLVSNKGAVFSLKKNRRLNGYINQYGYIAYALRINGKTQSMLAHRLVCMAFHNSFDKTKVVNHRDAIKTNNHINNLEMCSIAENTSHAKSLGLHIRGANHPISKLKDHEVLKIREEHKSMTVSALSRKYGVARNAIYQVVNGRTWRHVKRILEA
jgi:HNH endonuclease/NUMOD4 motif